MQKLLCKVGFHSYKTVEMTDCFTTEYTDTNWGRIKHIVWYQVCSCCGKRRVKDTHENDTVSDKKHVGIEYARVSWVEHSEAYIGKNKVKKYTNRLRQAKTNKPKLTAIEGDMK